MENGEQLKNKYKPCSLSKAVAGKCPAHLEHIKELTEYAEYVLANDPIAGENKYIILFFDSWSRGCARFHSSLGMFAPILVSER